MSIELPSHRPPLNEPSRALVHEFMKIHVYLGMGAQRSLETLASDMYRNAGSMLERAQLVLPDGTPRIEQGVRYATSSGAGVLYAETLCQAEAKQDTMVHKRLDIEGVTSIHTMMGRAEYDRVVIVGRFPQIKPPYLPETDRLIEKELAFYREGMGTPEALYRYEPSDEGATLILEEGREDVAIGDLLLTLAIAEVALAQPLERVDLPATL